MSSNIKAAEEVFGEIVEDRSEPSRHKKWMKRITNLKPNTSNEGADIVRRFEAAFERCAGATLALDWENKQKFIVEVLTELKPKFHGFSTLRTAIEVVKPWTSRGTEQEQKTWERMLALLREAETAQYVLYSHSTNPNSHN